MLSQLGLDRAEIHRVLDYARVVGDIQLNIVDWVLEDVSLRVSLQVLHHALRSFLPLIENESTIWNLRHLKLADGSFRLTIFICFEVGGQGRIIPLEVFEFSVGHRRVEATLSQLGKHVALRDLLLVDDGGGLRGFDHLLGFAYFVCWLTTFIRGGSVDLASVFLE